MAGFKAAIVGSGNIGSDLMVKILRDDTIEVGWMVGVEPDSEGLARARKYGVEASHEGVPWLLAQNEKPDVVFEATSARAHRENAPLYADAGIQAIDLTPAGVGPAVVPVVNLVDRLDAPNVNLTTCGGQATIPIVAAVSRVTEVPYAEIVSSISSRSAGPGTRANIDEFTKTTARAIERIGGAARGKAIIILNPAEPPLIMRNTVYCAVDDGVDRHTVKRSIEDMVTRVNEYVPGYRLKADPQFDDPSPAWNGYGRVAVFLEVEGNGDYLPPYAGNLDIMTAAAVRVGTELAAHKLETIVK
ncbi:MAG TPA: acetaldehyde dehydrogenase (acetylating) [Gaiellaceae bacterium]|nr:acetaldehyde dehydrogenase (acetylating) [Gaiellaceae bacterium]